MQRNFLSVKKFLEDTFPDLAGKVTGANYPPPPIVELLLKILSYIQFLAMAFIIFGDRVWTSFLQFRQVPSWYYTVKKYGFQCGVVLFFVLPNMMNRYVVTGAFEIMVDDELLYSKLELGRMPNAGELVRIFEKLGLTQSHV